MAKCGISFCNQIRFSNIVTVMNIRHPKLKDNWSSKGCCLHRTHLIFRDILHINALKSTHNNHTKWNKLEHHCYKFGTMGSPYSTEKIQITHKHFLVLEIDIPSLLINLRTTNREIKLEQCLRLSGNEYIGSVLQVDLISLKSA